MPIQWRQVARTKKPAGILTGALLVVVGFSVRTATLAAQSMPRPEIVRGAGNPVEIEDCTCSRAEPERNSHPDRPQVECRAILVNRSKVGVKSLGLRFESIGNEGSELGHGSRTSDTSHPLPAGRGPYAPGEMIVVGSITPFPESQKIRIRVHFVEFTDGSVWGPSDSPEILEIRGARLGAETIQWLAKELSRKLTPGGVLDSLERLDVETLDFGSVQDANVVTAARASARQAIDFLRELRLTKGDAAALAAATVH